MTYKCTACGDEKKVSKSYLASNRNLAQVCLKCRRRGAATTHVTDDGRVCTGCNLFLPWSSYAGNSPGRKTKIARCKDCTLSDWTKKRAAWSPAEEAAYKQRCRENHWRRAYNLSPTEAEALYTAADNACQICKSSTDLCIDHNHSTKKVRGILCRQCNKGLGNLKDDAAILEAAVRYLRETQD